MKLSETQRTVLACLALLALTLAIYAQCLGHEFVDVDTAQYITQNPPVLRGLSWSGFEWAFTTFQAANWHPLTWLAHMLDVSLFGTRPAGHHAVNIVLHAANGMLLWLVLKRLSGSYGKSLLVAALFVAHPLHVESVAWIVERKDVLSTFFGLLCVLAWIAYAQSGSLAKYALAFVCLALGLLAKPMLVTWPFVLLLLDIGPLARASVGWMRLAVEKLPFLALSIASCVVTVNAQTAGGAVQSLSSLSIDRRICDAVVSYATYLAKAFAPTGLAVYYPLPDGGFDTPDVVIDALVLVVVSALALWQIRSRPWILVGWLFYLGTLVPVIGLMQVGGQSMADRYTYVPLVGVFVALVWTIGQWITNALLARTLAVVIVATSAAFAWRQAGFWQNSVTLGEHAIEVTGENHKAENLVGFRLDANGDVVDAVPHFEAAVLIEPGDVDARDNLGSALLKLGRLDDAEAQLRTGLSIQSTNTHVLAHLGAVLLAENRLDEALAMLRESVRLAPDQPGPLATLGVALERKLDHAAAEKAYLRALQLQIDNVTAMIGLARIEIERGAFDRATPRVLRALALEPSDPHALQLFARIHTAHGDTRAAITALEGALRSRPSWPLAMSDLAWALATAADAKLRDPARAIVLAQQSVAGANESRPEFLDVLAVAYAAGGRFEEAQSTAASALEKARAENNADLASRIERRLAGYKERRLDPTIPR